MLLIKNKGSECPRMPGNQKFCKLAGVLLCALPILNCQISLAEPTALPQTTQAEKASGTAAPQILAEPMRGTAQVLCKNNAALAGTWQELTDTCAVALNSVIRTDKKSYLQLRMTSGIIVRLWRYSELEIISFDSIKLLKGSALIHVPCDGQSVLRLHTKNSVTTVSRGCAVVSSSEEIDRIRSVEGDKLWSINLEAEGVVPLSPTVSRKLSIGVANSSELSRPLAELRTTVKMGALQKRTQQSRKIRSQNTAACPILRMENKGEGSKATSVDGVPCPVRKNTLGPPIPIIPSVPPEAGS